MGQNQTFSWEIVDKSAFCGKIAKDMQKHCGNEKTKLPASERGYGESPQGKPPSATSKQPGMTGTGAPVTEQLRYRHWR